MKVVNPVGRDLEKEHAEMTSALATCRCASSSVYSGGMAGYGDGGSGYCYCGNITSNLHIRLSSY